ncbi:MAG: adenylate/guanylate cyclase domain-containing protein [Alphaproteobacteria bacterium]|nr:adenylate/guanylate cyclase domain-containing protein [Alphaproteobacteria bacterium]
MTTANPETSGNDIGEQLRSAQAKGLRLALLGRSLALLPAAAWFISLGAERTGIVIGVTLLLFAAAGFAFRAIVGTRYNHPLYKYVFFTIDIIAIGAVFAFAPLSQGGDVPQVFVYRGLGIYYFFIVLGVAALTLSPGLLIWCGTAITATWWAVFAFIVSGMERTVSWGDLPLGAPGDVYISLVLDPDFIARGSRFEESITIFVTSLLLAFAVHRARTVVADWAEAEADRTRVTDLFGQFVPGAVIDRLLRDRRALAPAQHEATVLFLDVAGFTSLSEKRTPADVIATLNRVFDAAGGCIGRCGGVVTNLQGDGLLAVFNVPAEIEDHAGAAVAAATEIARVVSGRDYEGVRIDVRVGIHTGPVAAGVVGSGHRQVYTVYGDTVNVASRLEQANKEYGTVVLASAATVDRLDRPPDGFRDMGETAVRGHSAAIRVYGLAR